MASASERALEGRVAFVTGAGSGIGAAVARRFGGQGARVYLTDIDQAAVDALARDLRDDGVDARARALDVTDDDDVGRAVADAVSGMGRLDTVVACAGVLAVRSCAETLPAELERVMRINLVGVHNAFRHALPAVRAAGDGVLLAIASLASSHGSAGLGAYAASKFALLGLTQALAQEEAPHGVRVCTVAPGFVRTGMLSDLAEAGAGGDPGTAEAGIAERVALGRLGTPEEIADVLAFLSSQGARYVTGANVAVDGGYRR